MISPSHRIARGYAERYRPLRMKRILGLFVYHQQKSCPLCGSSHVHRTKRGRILEFWVLLFLPVRPYRCGKCRQRFYGPKKFASTARRYPDKAADSCLPKKVRAPSRSQSESSRR